VTTGYDDSLLTIADGVPTIRRYFVPIGGSTRIGLGAPATGSAAAASD
jgi:hypothetical protein